MTEDTENTEDTEDIIKYYLGLIAIPGAFNSEDICETCITFLRNGTGYKKNRIAHLLKIILFFVQHVHTVNSVLCLYQDDNKSFVKIEFYREFSYRLSFYIKNETGEFVEKKNACFSIA